MQTLSEEKDNGTIILDLIEQNFYDPNFNVDKLAYYLNIHTSTLRELVKKYYHHSCHHLIENYRLEKALDLLIIGLSISEVSLKCGYSTTRSFRNAFKKRFNQLPSSFINDTGQFQDLRMTNIVQFYKKVLWSNNNGY